MLWLLMLWLLMLRLTSEVMLPDTTALLVELAVDTPFIPSPRNALIIQAINWCNYMNKTENLIQRSGFLDNN